MLMREEYTKDYDDFTLRDYQDQELSGSLSPFTFLCVVAVLTLFGLIMAYSASYDAALREGYAHYHYLLEMVTYGFFALISSLVLFFMPRKKLEKLFYFTFPLSLLLLLINLLSSLSLLDESFLSGFPSLNGSDAMVFSTVLMLSFLLPRIKEKEGRGYFYVLFFILSLLMTAIMVFSFNFCYAILFFFTCAVTLYSAGLDKKYVFFYLLFNLTLAVFIILSSPRYMDTLFSRLMPYYLDTRDALSASNCLSAIAEGGIFGKGIGASYYKLGQIEGVEDEYIFAVVAEESGLLGIMMILLFFFLFLFLGIRCAHRSRKLGDDYITEVSLSFSFLIVFKAILSMLAASAVIPASGIEMPFFSADGFSYFLTIIECAFLYRFMHITGRGYEKVRD